MTGVTFSDRNLLEAPFRPEEQQLVELWKHFETVGDNAKEQTTKMVSWMLTFAGGILSYVFGFTFFRDKGSIFCLHDPAIAYAGSLTGAVICGLTIAMIREFKYHTYRNWWRATQCKNNVPRLHLLVTGSQHIAPLGPQETFEPEDSRVASIFRLFYVVSGGFLAFHMAVFAMHWFRIQQC
ncbi:hypothetical protein [Mesorhizobium sp. CN2-181]|uniref:hypothetical protein n=1 Tax=Mesorhizobium yinganensis TaxID=3157707 RepID=UPI0032B84D49